MRIAEVFIDGETVLIKPLLGVNNSGISIEAIKILNMAPLEELIRAGWVEVVN